MKSFTKNELKAVLTILLLIFVASINNFRIAERRARDNQRRGDLGNIYNALYKYQKDFGRFPYSSREGKIKACKPDNFDELVQGSYEGEKFLIETYLEGLKECEWGLDSLQDVSDDHYSPYISRLPRDPRYENNLAYFYLSNGRKFQIYAYLEGGEEEIGFSSGIVNRNLSCGNKICNFGRAYGEVPLDKSIEEYENELLEKVKNSPKN